MGSDILMEFSNGVSVEFSIKLSFVSTCKTIFSGS